MAVITLIGIWIDPDRAFAWGDSEGFLRDPASRKLVRSTGHGLKLATNNLARIAAVGAGDAGGNRMIAEAVEFAASFDDLLVGLPRYLRIGAEERLEWPDWVGAAIGWSSRRRRMMGAVFDQKRKFVPALTSCFTLPDTGAFQVSDEFDLVGVAQQQMQRLKDRNPLAGGGILTLARVDHSGIETSAWDIPTGQRLTAVPAELTPMAALPSAPGGQSPPL